MRKKKHRECKKCGSVFMAVRSDAMNCLDCHKKRTKAWQTSTRGRMMRSMALKKTRQIVIDAYGGGCACCGERHYEFLSVDHVNGGGRKERVNLSTQQIVLKIIRENFPAKYRILCHNCNMALGFYGFCPHKRTA